MASGSLITSLSGILRARGERAGGGAQVRQLLLEPAVKRELERLRGELEAKAREAKALQEELQAVHFSQDSKSGRMLMAKCRALQASPRNEGQNGLTLGFQLIFMRVSKALRGIGYVWSRALESLMTLQVCATLFLCPLPITPLSGGVSYSD